MLVGFPESFNPLVMAVENSTKELKIDDVKTLQEPRFNQTSDTSSGFFSKSKKKTGNVTIVGKQRTRPEQIKISDVLVYHLHWTGNQYWTPIPSQYLIPTIVLVTWPEKQVKTLISINSEVIQELHRAHQNSVFHPSQLQKPLKIPRKLFRTYNQCSREKPISRCWKKDP